MFTLGQRAIMMQSQAEITLTALKYLAGETDHICRLCFSSTETSEISIEDTTRLQRPYVDETVTFTDMFEELGVTIEQDLPQVMCSSCAMMTINSYLFIKLCQHANEQWSNILNKFDKTLDQSDTVGPNIQTIYLMVHNSENLMFTSKKSHTLKSKKTALSKIKDILKSRESYVKVRQKSANIICEECGERFKTNCHLVKHLRLHSNIQYPCKQCTKVFASQHQLEDHAERVHYPKRIKCPKCFKMFSTDKMLKHHNKLHHVSAICKLCFVQFPSKKDLRAHLDKHDINKCPLCNKAFLNKHTFKFHLKICGKSDERQPSFFCDLCNKGYARKNGLRTHLKTDHGFGNVISCNWCDKKFDAISRLRNHIVKHTKERNYHCEHCGNKFVTQAALVYHIRLHTGERPFPCDMCGESFLSASRRMEHKRRKHFGPTKECPVCHVKFVTGHQLRKHVQRHYNPHSKLFVPEANMLQPNDKTIINVKDQEYLKTDLLT